MASRTEYYANLPNYYLAEELYQKFKNNSSESDIITFLKNNKLDPNIYIKGKKNEWIPLIYQCCRTDKYPEVVKYLVKAGANTSLSPDGDNSENLLLVCHGNYIKFLYDRGLRIPAACISTGIIHRLHCADAKRLKALLRLKLCNKEQIITACNDPIYFCLKAMKDYLVYVFNMKSSSSVPKTTELHQTLDKYKDCIQSLIAWGAIISEEALSFCIKYYLYEFLELPGFKERPGGPPGPTYHEQMEALEVAILRPLLNDFRYERTCRVLNVVPNKELFFLPIDISRTH